MCYKNNSNNFTTGRKISLYDRAYEKIKRQKDTSFIIMLLRIQVSEGIFRRFLLCTH